VGVDGARRGLLHWFYSTRGGAGDGGLRQEGVGVPDLHGGDDAPCQDLAMQGWPCDMRALQGAGTHPAIVSSCSLSDMQDLTFHRAKPRSRADLKEPLLYFRKVINDQ